MPRPKSVGKTSGGKSVVETSGGGYVGGGVSLEGKSTFIGRDNYEGLTPEEVDQLFKIFLKYISKNTDPKKLEADLEELRKCHSIVKEWKDIHNGLDEVLNAFNQFRPEIDRQNASHQKLDISSLQTCWLAVSMKVDFLLEEARKIHYIGTPYDEMVDQNNYLQPRGEKWATDISIQRWLISRRLGVMCNPPVDTVDDVSSELRFSIFFGTKPSWWRGLYEMSSQFYNTAFTHMHQVDKHLRESAFELALLSERIFEKAQS